MNSSILRRNSLLFSLTLTFIFITSFFSASKATANGGTTLIIPAIEVNAPVMPIYVKQFADGSVTWDTAGLNMTVGFLDGTANFGQPGNTVLGGHSELARGQADVFYRLDQVNVGDEIIVNVNGTDLRYGVTNVYTVSYTDLGPIYPTANEQLTLITCDLGSYNGSNGGYSNRIVVTANRIG